MTDLTSIIIAAIGATAPTLAVVLAIKKIDNVHTAINSRLDEWLAVERKQGHADGRAEEKAEAKARADQCPPPTGG